MSLNSKSLLVLFLVFLAGSAVGFLVGGYTGTNFGMKIILGGIALRALRGGDSEQAIELLEAAIDDQLVIFDPQEPYPIDDTTQDRVNNSIKTVYAYRQEFPRQSNRPQVDAMVKSLFDKHQLD